MSQAGSALGLVLLLVLVTFQSVEVRLGDLDFLLHRAGREEGSGDDIELVGRYRLLLERQQQSTPTFDEYLLEVRIVSLSSDALLGESGADEANYRNLQPARSLVNSVRFVLGKEPRSDKMDRSAVEGLEAAYAWQRLRRYERAVAGYDTILARNDLSRDLRARILMHYAFCLSLLDDYEGAVREYRRVIQDFSESTSADTALRLLALLEALRAGVGPVATDNSIDEAVRNYQSLQYQSAIDRLVVSLEGRLSPDEEAKGRYYLGRSQEELGRTEEAVREYERVLWLAEDSEWARNAARRIVLLTELYEEALFISEETRDRMSRQNDTAFVTAIEEYLQLREQATSLASSTAEGDSRSSSSQGSREVWIQSEPQGLVVLLGGVPIGATPLVLEQLVPGEHSLELVTSDGTEQVVVSVPPAGRVEVSFSALESTDAPQQVSFTPPANPSTSPPAAPETEDDLAETPSFEKEPPGRLLLRGSLARELESKEERLFDPLPLDSDAVAGANNLAERAREGGFATLTERADELARAFEYRKAHEEHLDGRMLELVAQEDELRREYRIWADRSRRRRLLSVGSLIVGTAGTVVATTSFVSAQQMGAASDNAVAQAEAGQLTTTGVSSAIVGVAGLVTGVVLRIRAGSSRPYQERLRSIRAEKEEVQGQYGYPEDGPDLGLSLDPDAIIR